MPPPVPLPQIIFGKTDLEAPGLTLLNQHLSNIVQALNNLQGFAGKTTVNSPYDFSGNKVTGVAEPSDPTDAINKAYADKNYGAAAVQPMLDILGNQVMQSTRRLNDPTQSESYSSFLNGTLNTAPTTNTSTVSFSAPSGGFVPTTVSAGVHQRVDGSTVPYAAYNDSLPVPGGTAVYYYYLRSMTNTLQREGPFSSDAQTNRLSSNTDGQVLIAVATVNGSGGVTTASAGGATDPSTTGGNRILGRL